MPGMIRKSRGFCDAVPTVRIRLPPARSLQTFGPSHSVARSRRNQERTEASGGRRWHRFGEENPGMRTVARARSFDGDRDAFCPRRVTECSNILHPGLLVEIDG